MEAKNSERGGGGLFDKNRVCSESNKAPRALRVKTFYQPMQPVRATVQINYSRRLIVLSFSYIEDWCHIYTLFKIMVPA